MPIRSSIHSSVRPILLSLAVVFALTSLGAVASAQQTPTPATTTQQGLPGLSPNPAPPDGTLVHMKERMARERNDDRQAQIVADSARLLKLAKQLNADVSKSDKYTLSISVVKEASEIEKLAKTIKDRMKEGY